MLLKNAITKMNASLLQILTHLSTLMEIMEPSCAPNKEINIEFKVQLLKEYTSSCSISSKKFKNTKNKVIIYFHFPFIYILNTSNNQKVLKYYK